MKRLVCLFLCFFMGIASYTASAATKGEENALATANSYLSFTHFSYKGLMDQLEYDGYSYTECKYAADYCGEDWYDQAAGSAQDYMSFTSFSKKSLVEQLEYDGYTKEEAEYGAAVAYDENPTKPYSKYNNMASSTDNSDNEESFISFTPTLTNSLDYTSSKWYSDGLYRALLTVLISADYLNSFDNSEEAITPDFVNCSYVGKNGLDLAILLWDERGDRQILIIYRPMAEMASYRISEYENVTSDSTRQFLSALLLNMACEDSYYQNEDEDLLYIAEALATE